LQVGFDGAEPERAVSEKRTIIETERELRCSRRHGAVPIADRAVVAIGEDQRAAHLERAVGSPELECGGHEARVRRAEQGVDRSLRGTGPAELLRGYDRRGSDRGRDRQRGNPHADAAAKM
jgi:hypothetical protein